MGIGNAIIGTVVVTLIASLSWQLNLGRIFGRWWILFQLNLALGFRSG